MSFNNDRQVIEQFFIDNLPHPLRFEGHDYPNQTPPFVGVIISPTARANEDLNSTKRIDGTILLRLLTVRADGIEQLLSLCDEVAGIIDNQVIDGVTTYAMDAPVQFDTDDAYLGKEISIPYYSS